MKIGVISDTHSNLAYQTKAVVAMQELGVCAIIHAGDYYRDTFDIECFEIPIHRVPGYGETEYTQKSTPNNIEVKFGNFNIAVGHILENIPVANSTDIIIYGHAHHANIKEINGQLYINPGHLKASIDRNTPASYAILEIEKNSVDVSIYSLRNNELLHGKFYTREK